MTQKSLPKGDERVIDGSYTDDTALQAELDDELTSVLAEFGTDANDTQWKIKVYRVLEGKGQMEWIFDCVPSEFPILERLRDEYGGGTFECRMYQTDGTRHQLRKKPVLRVGKPRAVVQQNQTGSGELASVLRAMQDAQQKQFEQMREMFQATTGKGAAPTDTLSVITGVMAAIGQIKDVIAPPQTNSFEHFLKLLEVAKDFSGGGGDGGGSNMWDVIGKVVNSPLIAGLAENVAQARALPSATAGQIPHQPQPQDAGTGEASAPTQPQTENERMYQKVMQELDKLIIKAAAGADPGFWSDYVIEEFGEAFCRQNLLMPSAIDQLEAVKPAMKPHRAWFEALHAELVKTLSGSGEAPPA